MILFKKVSYQNQKTDIKQKQLEIKASVQSFHLKPKGKVRYLRFSVGLLASYPGSPIDATTKS